MQIHKYTIWKTPHVVYLWKEGCSRILKMIFPCIKNANTKIQIHKYTNIAYDKVPERPRCKTRKYTLTLFVYSCICISAFACQTPGNIVFKSSCHYLFKICHMLGLFSNLTQTVFVYLCIWMSDTREHCFWGPRTICLSKIYHIMGLFRVFLLQSSAMLISGMVGWMGLNEPNLKSSQLLQFRARFCQNCKFLFFLIEKCPGAIFWTFFGQDRTRVWHKNGRQTLSQRKESCVT